MKNKWINYVYFALLAIYSVLFFFVIGEDGPYLMRDSYAFISMSAGDISFRYGLYALFLKVCRLLFGETAYLFVVYVIQSLFAILMIYLVTDFLRKTYGFSYAVSAAIYVILCLPYGYSLPENVVTHHILTEALALPVFYLLVLTIFRLFLEQKVHVRDKLICAIVSESISCVLAAIRPHLSFLIFTTSVILFIYFIGHLTKCKRTYRVGIWMCISILMISVLLSPILLEKILEYSWHGSQIIDASSGRIIWCSVDEDIDKIDEDIRKLFETVYGEEERLGHLRNEYDHNKRYADELVYHTNEINKNCLKIIEENYLQLYDSPEQLTSAEIRKKIMISLLDDHKKEWLSDAFVYMEKSMVASIFIQPDRIYVLCHIIAWLMFGASQVLFFVSEYVYKIDKRYTIPLGIISYILVSNVIYTNVVMFGIQRYVIYTQGLFYVAFGILIYSLWRNVPKKVVRTNEVDSD